MPFFRKIALLYIALLYIALLPLSLAAQTYSTGFEPPTFALGDVRNQNGWGHLDNSYTGGTVVAVPAGTPALLGAQSLAVRSRSEIYFGVANHLHSAPAGGAAGETGSTLGGVVVATPHSTFTASFWYRTPSVPLISTVSDGRMAEMNPSSKGAAITDAENRYAQVRVINTTNDVNGVPRVQVGWYLGNGTFTRVNVATLQWGTWYRFEYVLQPVDGLAAGNDPNDRLRVVIRDANGVELGSACGSTWESAWKSGSFGGGTTPRAVNVIGFWSHIKPEATVVGHVDEFSITASTPPASPLQATITGATTVCSGGMTTLSANGTGGSGSIVSYVWRDAGNAVVGNASTLTAGAGTYTVTVTDSYCVSAASAPITVTAYAPLAATITGTATVCYGGSTTLSASVSGGSGSIASYTWRNASNAVVGTAASATVPAGTYTVTVSDGACGAVTSAPVTVQTTCPATPVVTVTGGTFTYDGATHPATAVARDADGNPVSGTFSFTYNGSSTVPVNVGTYNVVATFTSGDPNFANASGGGTIVIAPATPVITVSGGTFIFDAAAHPATAVARDASGNAVNGTFAFTYNGSSAVPLNAGTYNVVATFTTSDPNFTGAAGSGTITIDKAPTSIAITSVAPTPSRVGERVTIAFTVTGLRGEADGTINAGGGAESCTTGATASGCAVTFGVPGSVAISAFYSGDANHHGSTSISVMHRVDDAAATATLDGGTAICRGAVAVLRVQLTGRGPWTIQWSDGVTETSATAVHVRSVAPAQTSTYTLTAVSDANGSGSVAGSAGVEVVTVPQPAIDAPRAEAGKPVTLRATAGFASYQWFRDGAPLGGATSSELVIAAAGASDLGSYTVVAYRNGCASAASLPYTLVFLGLPTNDDAIIPVVGNTRGAQGSLFRTTVHLVNSTSEVMVGELTFLDAALPKVPYSLQPGETRFIDNLLPASFLGLTSVNIRRLSGPLPISVTHVFNDAGALGRSGLMEREVLLRDTLRAGDRAVLLTPADPLTTRFNIGLRSLSEGMTVRVLRRDAAGRVQSEAQRVVPPSTLIHDSVASLIGSQIGSGESLTFEVLSGGGVIYGAATDNGTNDPNIQIAARIEPQFSARAVLPVAGAVDGLFGSRFATALQLHNPSDRDLVARLTFHPGGVPGTAGDPTTTVTIAAGATSSIGDVVAMFGRSGIGSVEVDAVSPLQPVLLARIYSITAAGQLSFTTELVPDADALIAGEQGTVVASHAAQTSRLNIGIRTLADGVRMTATVRGPAGDVRKRVALSYGPLFFTQASAETLLGVTLTGDESIVFAIEEGSAIVYATWTDNITQDPAMQLAARP